MIPIKPLLMGAVQTALNQYLALADNRAGYLAPLAGKVIAVTVQPFALTFYLCPAEESFQLLDAYPGDADTHISGSLFALGLMGLSSKPMRSVFSGEVKIEGDTHVGRKLQELFANLDINLEPKLARYTGESFAHTVAGLFRSTQSWSAETLETLSLNTSEFLQEETRDLPASPEMDYFCGQVDELRLDYDRLQLRVERLEKLLLGRVSEA